MSRDAVPELVDVGAGNVEKTGVFCFMSKKKSEGYHYLLEKDLLPLLSPPPRREARPPRRDR